MRQLGQLRGAGPIAVIGRGFPGIAHTSAARAGLLELARSLAIEWGPKVRVNCIAPGPIQTEAFKVTYDPQIETLCEGIPIPRFGGPDEIAYAVTRTLFTRLPEFRTLHLAFAKADGAEMLDQCLFAEVHPGAARYYREAGLAMPRRCLP